MSKFKFLNGKFYSESNTDTTIQYTDINIIKNNIDADAILLDVDSIITFKQDGYLGLWSYDLEEKSTIYYTVASTGISEFIAYMQPFPSGEIPYYIIEINGYIYNCLPENDDIIYTTYKEARLAFMQQENNKSVDIKATSDLNNNENNNFIDNFEYNYKISNNLF